MPRPQYFDIDPPDVDPDGIAENQTTGGAADLTLDGALCDLGTAGRFDIGDSYSDGIGGVRIAIDSAGDVSSVNFLVTGKDENGKAATETITGVTTTAVESTTYWSQITSIAADAEVTSNVFVGPVDEVITKAYYVNWRNREPATVSVYGLSGTIQYDIDQSFNDMSELPSSFSWLPVQANASANVVDSLDLHARFVRLVVDSYSSGAELQFAVLQN